MQALALRALAVKSPINATLPCWRLPERVALISTHTRPAASYNISRSVHASQEEPSDSESAMDAQKKADAEAGTKTFHSDRDDMADSFGDAYSTRSSDEGFGQRYTEHIKCGPALSEGAEATVERDADPHVEVRREYDESQGSEVREKEKARHATEHTAFLAHNRPTPRGVGGTAT
uniref:Late embryogenesis abundant protein n=1 Tax=Picea glauca TaxID=3330 RepID=Q3I3Y9_PICGL|nr:late embryogenesis abundant protein [Picea glauca]